MWCFEENKDYLSMQVSIQGMDELAIGWVLASKKNTFWWDDWVQGQPIWSYIQVKLFYYFAYLDLIDIGLA